MVVTTVAGYYTSTGIVTVTSSCGTEWCQHLQQTSCPLCLLPAGPPTASSSDNQRLHVTATQSAQSIQPTQFAPAPAPALTADSYLDQYLRSGGRHEVEEPIHAHGSTLTVSLHPSTSRSCYLSPKISSLTPPCLSPRLPSLPPARLPSLPLSLPPYSPSHPP